MTGNGEADMKFVSNDEMVKVRGIVGSLIGMTFLWSFLRFQSFFGFLYPLTAVVGNGGQSISVYTVFIGVLLIGTLFIIVFASAADSILMNRRGVVVFLSAIGTFGAFLALIARRGVAPPWVYWLSIPCVVVGFLANYLCWAICCSRNFNRKTIVLLAASFLFSLLLSRWMIDTVRVLSPLIVGLAWCIMPPQGSSSGVQSSPGSGNDWKRAYLYIGLFIIFLLAGAVVRGLVDVGDATVGSQFRFYASIGIAACVLLVCGLFARGTKGRFGGRFSSLGERYATEFLVLLCWVVLALLFLVGIFIGLVSGSFSVGGQIVVVARSTLDLFLWILLCNLASNHETIRVRLFAVCGVLTETASWFFSYTMVPVLLDEVGDGIANTVVLILLFLLMAVATVTFGVILLRRRPPLAALVCEMTDDAHEEVRLIRLPPDEVDKYALTAREVEVIELFSQGYSLKKVADKLFISVSTAQSHVKSAYRKLGVHSKDELKDLIGSWNI